MEICSEEMSSTIFEEPACKAFVAQCTASNVQDSEEMPSTIFQESACTVEQCTASNVQDSEEMSSTIFQESASNVVQCRASDMEPEYAFVAGNQTFIIKPVQSQ